jgi:hypothetical protein
MGSLIPISFESWLNLLVTAGVSATSGLGMGIMLFSVMCVIAVFKKVLRDFLG